MKQLILFCLLVCFPSQSFGEGIFGLKKGMSINEIRTLDFGDIKQHPDNPDVYMINEPKKPKDVTLVQLFVTPPNGQLPFALAKNAKAIALVQLFVTPPNGLLKIGFIWSIKTNVYGDGIRQKFDELHDILTKKYGKGKKYDYLKHDSIWDEPKDWMMGLLKEERRLVWFSDITGSNKQTLTGIALEAQAFSREKAALYLKYEFQGFSEYMEKKEAEEASQF